jgi:hypothetical protein
VGIGGAAASLLGVLTEAAVGFWSSLKPAVRGNTMLFIWHLCAALKDVSFFFLPSISKAFMPIWLAPLCLFIFTPCLMCARRYGNYRTM